jgi:hypothetical protein
MGNEGAPDPDDEQNGSESPSGKLHWINHATFYLSLILAVLTLGTFRVYWLQLQQMEKQTTAAESSSYAACMSAQIARQTLLEVQSGEADTHGAASATVAHATVTVRLDSPLFSFVPTITYQSPVQEEPKNWDGVHFALAIFNVGLTAAKRVRVKYATQLLPQADDPSLFDSSIRYDSAQTGVATPNAFQGGPVSAGLRYLDKHGKPIGPLNREQLEDLRTGKLYLVIFGRAEYGDTFGLDHWQTFCAMVDRFQSDLTALPSKKMRHGVCGDYNDMDKNLIY